MTINLNKLSRFFFTLLILLSSAGQANAVCTSTTTNSVTITSGLASSGNGDCLENTATGIINESSLGNALFTNYSIESLINAGQSNTSATAIFNDHGTITTLTNSGSITTGHDYSAGIRNDGDIVNLNQSGTINASGGNGNIRGILNLGGSATITNLVNTGTISATGGTASYGIENEGNGGSAIIQTLTNSGTITGQSYGIRNAGAITTLNNAQGAGNINNALTYTGTLPTYYNIIINSISNYGQLSVTSGAGSTTFGIYTGSTITNGTYTSAVTGLSSGNLSITSGNFGSATWLLSNSSGSIWDLIISGFVASTDINAGTSVALSAIGTTSNPVFDGGTLTTTNGESSSTPFTINAGGGTITSPTVGSVTFSGGFSGVGAMTYSGTGTTYMNGTNTYAGGTTVSSGTLSVGSNEANKTASLAGDVAVAAAGTLAGHGSIGGSVSNSGKVAPGGSIGTLTVNGNYVQNSSATLMTTITPTENSVLAVSGTAALAGTFQIDAESGSYTKRRYTVLTSSGLSGTFSNLTGNLANYSTLNAGLSYDANDAYLTLYAGTADTQQSIVNTASALQPIYTLQNTVLANSFAYDCTLFGSEGVCISAGGRNTAVQAANGLNNTSGLLIASYRLDKNNSRIGAYADQNLSVNNAGSAVTLGNNTPLVGLFGVWSERADAIGTEVKVSAAYGQKDTTITRQVVGTSDPGSGSSTLNSQGAQVVAKYGFALVDKVIVSPYVGIRYTQNNMGGYTEGTSATVTAPLTYSALNTNATTALAGVGASYKVIPTVTAFASAGVETDTNTANGSYSATSSSISGLTPVNFNANPVKTRPTATLGAYYDLAKNQRFGVTGIYRQEAYQAVSSTTVMATYMIGL